MGTFYDYYVINIFYNNTRIDDLSPEEFSFAISDSIYSLYPTGYFTINDVSSYFQEGLVTAPGAEVRIEYGDKDNVNKCNFVVMQDTLHNAQHHTILKGDLEIPLIHGWYNEQKVLCQGYKEKISNIVSDLVSKYNFEDTDIDDTENNDYWLQTYQTDAGFIQNTLLPNCFSVDANKTPFFTYITTDNVFHLRSYYSLSIKEVLGKIKYKSPFLKEEDNKIVLKNIATSAKRWRESLTTLHPNKNRNIFKIKSTDGSIESSVEAMNQHPSKGGSAIPIMNDHGEPTSYLNLQFTEETTGRKQNLTGQANYLYRNSIFIDYFQVIIPFNPVMHSGGLVDLMIFLPDNEGSKLAKNMAGQYMIVNCEHSWNKDNLEGYTNLILGRQYVQLPSAYTLKPKLIV